MEFPNCGVRCSTKECKQLDFLPFTCNYCFNVFCKEHFQITSHSCSKYDESFATRTEKTANLTCSQQSCTIKSPVEMPCVKCKKHFCLSHRYHGCLEQSEEEKLKELKKWEKPKQEFLESKNAIDEEVTNKLRKSKNSTMRNKVQLMRLKGKSIGPSNIPIIDRRYFLVYPPITGPTKIFVGSKCAFVSVNWSIGKVIDSLANLLNIPNFNNVANAKKLRIFNYLTGNIVTKIMDVTLSEILNANSLIDGQIIILEYYSNDEIDCSLYK